MKNYWEPFEYDITYHLYNKSIGGCKLFIQEEDYVRFLNKYYQYFGSYTTLIAYCLIPNHFHFMIRILKEKDINRKVLLKEKSSAAETLINDSSQINDFLTDQTRRWYSSTALYLNHKYEKHGQVFLEKSKRISVSRDLKFHDLLCYIHHNPIHHGLSKSYKEWPYSSYNLYLQSSPEIASSETFGVLGNGDTIKGKKHFIDMHKEYKVDFDWEGYRRKR